MNIETSEVETLPAPPAEEPKTEAPVVEAVAEGEQPEVVEETPEQQQKKELSKNQRRIANANRRAAEAAAEAKLLRERVAALEAERAPKPAEAPRREDFADDVAYLEARADHAARRAAAESREADRKESEGQQRQTKQQEEDAKVAESWTKREAVFQAHAKDYIDVVEPFVQEDLGHFSDGTKRLIVESEVGPQLLYHLATHPEDAERIADLSPVRQIAELGKLEDRMQRPAKAVSKAPAPINPVSAGRSGGKDVSKMSVAEYKAYRQNSSAWIR